MDQNQITVPVSDLDRSVAFYKKLGLHLMTYADHGYARFECPGGNTFSIAVTKDAIPDHPLTIYFENEKMDEEVARLKSMGIVFESEPMEMGWRWREARLRDPDGNRLCIYWAGIDRRFPPWRIEG